MRTNSTVFGLWTAVSLLATPCFALNFTVAGGQIFTPGLAVVNAPQPGTPLGGDQIEVSLDVSTNGRLPLPPYPEDSTTKIHNITIFLYSYDTGKNFTITNGTSVSSPNIPSLGDIMSSEPGSTVKHVKWTWPDCLVGDGQPRELDSARGIYNISIRQNFMLNSQNHYTIFDLPISVTNNIEPRSDRPSCAELENPLLSPEEIDYEGANDVPIMFAPGDATTIEPSLSGGINDGDGLGPTKPDATAADGLGSGAAALGLDGRGLVAGLVSLLGVFVSVVVL
ncbi:hypothetical protein V8F20_000678 [Naviculisporaceae sp. PSN 640]